MRETKGSRKPAVDVVLTKALFEGLFSDVEVTELSEG
jgi:hypothetical protein